MRYISSICFFIICSLFFSSLSYAHKVRIFAWGEGDTIHTESKFSGGRPAKNAVVTIIDNSTGQEILSGTTNQEGLFDFPVPDKAISEIDIIVNSGDGHKNHWTYQLSEPETSKNEMSSTQTKQVEPAPNGSRSIPVTEEQLTRIINTSLEKKLAPIRRQLAEAAEQEPDLKDILGGIGYIFGLAGIAAYMKSKK